MINKILELKDNSIYNFRADGDFSIIVKGGKVQLVPRTSCFIGKAEEPQYKHDCEHCTFVSYQIENPHDKEDPYGVYDFYYCKKEDEETIILRYGDKGHEYISGLGLKHPGILEATQYLQDIGVLK